MGLALFLLVDRSGSMSPHRQDVADMVMNTIAELDRTCIPWNAHLAFFDTETVIVEADHHDEVVEALRKHSPRGGTLLYHAMREVLPKLTSIVGAEFLRFELITDDATSDAAERDAVLHAYCALFRDRAREERHGTQLVMRAWQGNLPRPMAALRTTLLADRAVQRAISRKMFTLDECVGANFVKRQIGLSHSMISACAVGRVEPDLVLVPQLRHDGTPVEELTAILANDGTCRIAPMQLVLPRQATSPKQLIVGCDADEVGLTFASTGKNAAPFSPKQDIELSLAVRGRLRNRDCRVTVDLPGCSNDGTAASPITFNLRLRRSFLSQFFG